MHGVSFAVGGGKMETKAFGLVEVVAVKVGVEYVELDAEMGLVAFKIVKTGSVDGLGGGAREGCAC